MKGKNIPRHWLHWALRSAGGFSTILGLVVLLGWHIRNITLIQIFPAFVPMQYDSALGFLLGGIALLALSFAHLQLALVSSSLITVLSILQLIEYFLGIDLRIDQLLFTPSVAGIRPVPTTTLCFLLAGAALLLMSKRARLRHQLLIIGLLGSILLAIGGAVFSGYLTGMMTAYGWGRLTLMAVHTAMGFAVLGTGILAFVWQDAQVEETGLPRWLPLLVGVGVMTISLALWRALIAQEAAQFERTMKLVAAGAKNELTTQINSHLLALIRLARRWELLGQPRQDEWDAEMRTYLRLYPGYHAIAWVDSSLHIQWVVPLEGNETLQNLDVGHEEQRRGALENARDHRTVMISPAVELGQQGRGFVAYVPLFPAEQFAGFVLGVVSFRDLLNPLVDEYVARGLSITIDAGGEELYQRTTGNSRAEQQWGQEATIELHGVTWQLRVWPRSEILTEARSLLPEVALVMGLLLAFLLALTVHVAQAAQGRTHEVEHINQELTREIAKRQQAEENLARKNALVRLLQEITATANEAVTTEGALQSAIEKVCAYTGWCIGHVYLPAGGEPGVLSPSTIWYLGDSERFDTFRSETERNRIVPPEELPNQVLTSGQPQWILDVATDPHFSRAVQAQVIGIRAALAFPVLAGKEVVAVLEFFSAEAAAPDPSLLEVMASLGTQLGRVFERTRAEQRLREGERLTAMGAAASKIGHEIGNPLNGMYTTVQVLERHLAKQQHPDERLLTTVQDLKQETNRLRALLQELRFFSRPHTLDLHPRSLAALVANVLALQASYYAERQIHVEQVFPSDLPLVMADRDKLKQVLANLCKNAVEAMPEGGTLTLRGYLASEQVCLEVQDTGSGLPEGVDIFAPFITTKAAGTGLGLAIVQQIIGAHGGTITYTSAPGQGTTFTIWLPVASPAIQESGVQSPAPDAA